MPATADRVKETSTTTGTGTLTLAGAVTGFRTFDDAFEVGEIVQYAAELDGGSEWEVGYGTLASSSTLSRDRIIASSNSGSAVSFSSGTKNVFATATHLHIRNSNLGRILAIQRGQAMP